MRYAYFYTVYFQFIFWQIRFSQFCSVSHIWSSEAMQCIWKLIHIDCWYSFLISIYTFHLFYECAFAFLYLFLIFFTDWTILDEIFHLLYNCLPDDYLSALVKLKSVPQLSNDDHQQLGTMISSSCEAQLVNEKIVTFLIVKLCYNGSGGSLDGLFDVMDNLCQSDPSAGCVEEFKNGMCSIFSKTI